jgi:hypothetical protein
MDNSFTETVKEWHLYLSIYPLDNSQPTHEKTLQKHSMIVRAPWSHSPASKQDTQALTSGTTWAIATSTDRDSESPKRREHGNTPSPAHRDIPGPVMGPLSVSRVGTSLLNWTLGLKSRCLSGVNILREISRCWSWSWSCLALSWSRARRVRWTETTVSVWIKAQPSQQLPLPLFEGSRKTGLTHGHP